ncbi:hypothetical protein AMS68_003660 [Peltaster fructicola]|uniref:C2H2-type domain-containing protein n=1 Tax=Peltaster fructicola TaxID=286661 RepID=A0A6H0XTU7_9PEZI|nr:hypothetical protein AMS68_003660 [Peltaster fructicola]
MATDSNSVAIDPSLSIVDTHSPALATRLRSDSDQAKVIDPQLSQAEPLPLTLQVTDTAIGGASPTLSRQTSDTADTLRPLDAVSPSQESLASPARERLPSITQLTQQLTTHSLPALAEAATQQEARSQAYHHHSHSYGSNGPQSPLLSHHQQSPVTFPAFPNGLNARSPTTAISDTPYYQSPQTYGQPYGFYAHRRPSTAADQPATVPPSLPSASSSGDSMGPTGSSMDGYSTAHTTPIDPSQSTDTTPRANPGMLPPPGGFKCPYEGCNALPFQTQYLLTSHKNVHSQDRPHYCPVKDCPRGEGGKGFKRKNEMIRHGLVHKSPGYVCPFCPEREHKYPRPDNLQSLFAAQISLQPSQSMSHDDCIATTLTSIFVFTSFLTQIQPAFQETAPPGSPGAIDKAVAMLNLMGPISTFFAQYQGEIAASQLHFFEGDYLPKVEDLPVPAEAERGLDAVAALCDKSTHRELYAAAVKGLRHAYRIVALNPGTIGGRFGWIIGEEAISMANCVYRRLPEALIVLAYWAASLIPWPHWWGTDFAVMIILEVDQTLSEEYGHLLEWPRSRLLYR